MSIYNLGSPTLYDNLIYCSKKTGNTECGDKTGGEFGFCHEVVNVKVSSCNGEWCHGVCVPVVYLSCKSDDDCKSIGDPRTSGELHSYCQTDRCEYYGAVLMV